MVSMEQVVPLMQMMYVTHGVQELPTPYQVCVESYECELSLNENGVCGVVHHRLTFAYSRGG